MAGEDNKSFYETTYGPYIRHYKEDGWTYEKISRMAIYVFLYNKVRGMPKSFGFSNDDVSWRFNDYVRDHFEELCKKYNIQDHIPGLDLSGDHYDENGNKIKGGKDIFVSELNEYAQYATMLAAGTAGKQEPGARTRMPSDDTMIGLMEALKADRKKHFEILRANTKKDSGVNYDKSGKNKIGLLRAERYTVKKKIQERKKEMRETAFFGTLHGIGFAAAGGVAVASALILFAPATILGSGAAIAATALGRAAVGITGMILGGSLASGAGRRFVRSIAKFFGQFMNLRQNLYKKKGEPGKGRGLEDIDKDIALNEAVKYAYARFEKQVKHVVYFKRKKREGEHDLDAGKMLDKDGNIIAFGPNNELTAADGSKYIFNEEKLTLTGPVGGTSQKTFNIGFFGKLTDSSNNEIDIPGLQIPYVEAKKDVIPTREEFFQSILECKDKKERKILLPLIKADESEQELGKLYDRVKERYGYIYGVGKHTSGFVSTYRTVVEDNSEIVLEREDFYNKMFMIHFEGDVANPTKPPVGLNISESDIDFSQYPAFDKSSPQFAVEYNLNIPINEFVQALYELKQDKDKYSKHEEMIKYQHYLGRSADMMPVLFQREIFDRPFNGFTIRNCTTLLTNEVVSDALKRNYTGDKTLYVENSLRFIESENLDPVNKIRYDLGVPITAQYYSKATDMESAISKTFNIPTTDPDWGNIQNITTQIENMNNKEIAKSINTLIASLGNEKVRNYLYYMVERKENQVMHSKSHVLNELVGSDTSLLTDPTLVELSEILSSLKYDPETDSFTANFGGSTYTEQEIRERFRNQLGSYSDPQIRNRAETLLNQQCKSLERSYIDQNRGVTAKLIRENAMSADLREHFDYIEKLQFENLGSQELSQFYLEKLKRVQPPEICEYLRMKLRVKIESLYEYRFNQGNLYTGEKAMEELTADLQKVEIMTGILGEARKERILKGFEPKVKVAFDKMLTMKERYLLEMNNTDEFMAQIYNYRNLPYKAGGFNQFFGRGSSESDDVMNRLKRVEFLLRNVAELNGTGQGIPIQKDKKVPESKIFLGIYFKKDRDEKDPLFDSIKKVNRLMKQIQYTKLGVEPGNVDDCKDEIKKLMAFLDDTSPTANIKDVKDPLGNPADNAAEQAALLLIYKRKVMAMFKAHLKKVTFNKPDIQSYINGPGRPVIDKIIAHWRPLLHEIDERYAALQREATAGGYADVFSGLSYIKAEDTLEAISAEVNLMPYVLSDESVIMEK